MKCCKSVFGIVCRSGDMSVFSTWRIGMLKCIIFVMLFTHSLSYKYSGNSSNVFVEKCRRDCAIQRDPVVCGRFRMVRWLQDAKEKEFGFGPFKIVRIPSLEGGSILPQLPRVNETRNGLIDTLNFVRDAAEDLLTKRALVYTIEHTPGARSLSSGPIILDENEYVKMKLIKRGENTGEDRLFHKKKKHLILPLLILLNLIKLKLLLLPVFLGVHFIKKFLVIGSLFLPTLLAHLKICKVPHYPAHQAWATAADAPVDYPTGYGHEESPWIHRNDVQSHSYSGYGGYANPYSGYFQGYRQRR